MTGNPLKVAQVDRALLESRNLLPHCSPFSGLWMSELDNSRSRVELGMTYTPLSIYLRKLIDHYKNHPPSTPDGYRLRHKEVEQLGMPSYRLVMQMHKKSIDQLRRENLAGKTHNPTGTKGRPRRQKTNNPGR